MAGSDDDIQPVGGTSGAPFTGSIFPHAEVLIAGPLGATIPGQGLHPVQTQWPPRYLGLVPQTSAGHTLDVDGLESVRGCTPARSPSDGIVNDPGINPMLAIWSATKQRIGNYEYLVLPPTNPEGAQSKWVEPHHTGYPSNKILVRKSYEKAFSIFITENAKPKFHRQGSHLALGGTSGLGKSFFYRYIIWRLLHPDGIEVLKVPTTILLWTDPKEWLGYLYHDGSFYSVNSIANFLSKNVAQNMFNRQDAWVICDGAPPTSYMQCPTVVSSSPGNFHMNDINGAKKFFKTANCKVYLPPWTAEEIWAAAQHIHGLTTADEGHLLERFKMYGGIARSIFLNFTEKNEPLTSLFAFTDVATAINEVGAVELNHQKVSGMILHLIPDNTLKTISYQWASTQIMETAFAMMFQVSKNKIETLLHAGIGLHLGTFYGLLFEPYFHARVTHQGYSGKIRRLSPAPSTADISLKKVFSTTAATTSTAPTKRAWYGAKKLATEVSEHMIPVQQIHHFHIHHDIRIDRYNVPDRKNFAAVDSMAPALGEMYQVTSAESRSIKGMHLRPLKRFFKAYLESGKKVKLIFVVPPNRFENYTEQNYIFPAPKKDKKGKDEPVDEYDAAPWDEEEPIGGASEGDSTDKAALLQEVTSWVDQYVMEVNVDPLIRTVDKRVEEAAKKSFLQQWSPASSRSTTTREEGKTK